MAARLLERDLEWMVEALCCDDPDAEVDVDVDVVATEAGTAVELDGAVEIVVVVEAEAGTEAGSETGTAAPGFLLLERPTRARRANPASLLGRVELDPTLSLSLECSTTGSTGRESHESRRWTPAVPVRTPPEFIESTSKSSSLSSTLCTLSDTMPDVVFDDVLLMTDMRWSFNPTAPP